MEAILRTGTRYRLPDGDYAVLLQDTPVEIVGLSETDADDDVNVYLMAGTYVTVRNIDEIQL